MKTRKKWLGFNFNRDGWSTTHENKSDAWTQFVRDFRSDLKKMLAGTGIEVYQWKGNWFSGSGFLHAKEAGIWFYISHSDVRYWQDEWFYNLLVRRCDGPKDFHGHGNFYCSFYDLPEFIQRNWGQIL